MTLKKCLKRLRCIARKALFGYAWLWFFIESARVLTATLANSIGANSLNALLEPHLGRFGWIAYWLGQTWQFVSAVTLVVGRQEAHRWFRVKRGRRSADRMLVAFAAAGITFLTTLFIVGRILGFELVFPKSTAEAIELIVLVQVGSWASRLLHPATRRAIRRIKWLRPMLTTVVQTALDMTLGKHRRERRHASPRSSSNKRRAA
ncbi:MAG: hypothetical protein HY420_02410 [Candidatus Kerfeldbacteria bacterium]|nr:hypothetical protein [Candidatus Kerfeldbacteria bacterium]